jgi:hypothetical protein
VRPGETALVTGTCLDNTTLRVCSSEPACAPLCADLPAVQQWNGSIKAVIPRTFPLGVFTFSAVSGGAPLAASGVASGSGRAGASVVTNAPQVEWFSTDSWRAGSAFAGGDLVMYGKALAFSLPSEGDDSGVMDCLPLPPLVTAAPPLRPAPGLAVRLRAVSSGSGAAGAAYPLSVFGPASCFRLAARLPANIPDGNYSIELNNGLLPPGAAVPASAQLIVTVSAAAAPVWRNASWMVGVHCNATAIGTCLSKARAAGGGTVFVPPGFYRMAYGVTLGIGAYVALSGTTPHPEDTVLSWDDEPANGSSCTNTVVPWLPSTPRYPCALVYNAESFATAASQRKPLALRNLTLLVTSPAVKVLQMWDCAGCEVLNVAINVTIDPLRFPLAAPAPPLNIRHAQQWRAQGLRIRSGWGYCGNGSVTGTNHPQAAPWRLDTVSDGRLWDTVADLGCLGWSISCVQRVSIERTDVRTTSATRQRGNTLNPFCTPVDGAAGLACNDGVYFGQNYDAGTDVGRTWETFTQDGAGGSYAGPVTAVNVHPTTGRQTLQTAAVRPGVNAAAGYNVEPGNSVSVIYGPGLAQWRRVVAVEAVLDAQRNATGEFVIQVDAPFTLPLATNESVVAVSAFKGGLTFEANEWTNGTTLQTYGLSLDLVFSGNIIRNFFSGGLGIWGLGMARVGWQPSLRTLVERNAMLCSGSIRSFTSLFSPPPPDLGFNASLTVLNYAHTLRRNNMSGSGDVNIRGQVWDAIVEGNNFTAARCPEKIMAACPNIGGCSSVFSTGLTVLRGPGRATLGGGSGYDALQVPHYVYFASGATGPLPPIAPSCTATATPSASVSASATPTASTSASAVSATVTVTPTPSHSPASATASGTLAASVAASGTATAAPGASASGTASAAPTASGTSARPSPSAGLQASVDPASLAQPSTDPAAGAAAQGGGAAGNGTAVAPGSGGRMASGAAIGLAFACALVAGAGMAAAVVWLLRRQRVRRRRVGGGKGLATKTVPGAAADRTSRALAFDNPFRTGASGRDGAGSGVGVQMSPVGSFAAAAAAAEPASAAFVGGNFPVGSGGDVAGCSDDRAPLRGDRAAKMRVSQAPLAVSQPQRAEHASTRGSSV